VSSVISLFGCLYIFFIFKFIAISLMQTHFFLIY
jgi:hypothetical protein